MSGFNGAATFQLRIDVRYCMDKTIPESFNGAATFQLRIEKKEIAEGARLRALQWSRNFSVADCNMCPRSKSGPPKLQWSRNFSVADCCGYHNGVSDINEASMEPQLFSCGLLRRVFSVSWAMTSFNGAATFQLRIVAAKVTGRRWVGIASMEPQLFSCGLPTAAEDARANSRASMEPQLFSCGLCLVVMNDSLL